MSRSVLAKLGHIAKRVHEVYTPEAWVQIYYPLYYLAKAIRKHVGNEDRSDESTTRTLVAGAVGFLLLWILWLNVRFLTRKIFLKIAAKLLPSYIVDNGSREDSTTYQPRSNISPEVLDAHIETDVDRGLDESEIIRRRALYGRNEIELTPAWISAIVDVSTHSVAVPLEISIVLAFVLEDWLDAVILTAIFTWHVSHTLYSIRESRSLQDALIGNPNVRVTATRESKPVKLLAAELVPGDIVHISTGDVVPADIHILNTKEALAVDQSAITGNPVPVHKYNRDIIYFTTGVEYGNALGVVVGTARNTFIGRTVSTVTGRSHPKSGMRNNNDPYYVSEYRRVLQGVASVTITTAVLALALALTLREPMILKSFLELMLAIAVINVPTGRETVIQSLRATGAARLSKGQAIINGGVIIAEALAGIDVLCTDKTGTLTKDQLTMSEPYCIDCSAEELLLVAAFGLRVDSKGEFADLDPIDQVFAKSLGSEPGAMERWKQHKLVDAEPFNADTKMITALVEAPDGKRISSVRGAPKAVLDLCRRENPEIDRVKDNYITAAREFAERGYRTLAVARKLEDPGSRWELLGLTPMVDPQRDETPAAIKTAKSHGIAVKIITGDAKDFAKNEAKSMGLEEDTEPFFAGALREYLDENEHRQPEPDVLKRASEACIFAETFPEDKEAIVKMFREQGHRLAITGDGVRDGPALVRADCGIAVHGASERAQSSADIVFLAPGIERIIDAVYMSRQVLRQVHTYLIYRTAIGLHLAFLVSWSYIIHGTSAADLRWLMVNLHISDVVGMQLGDDGGGRTPFSKTPARWHVVKVLLIILALTAVQAVGTVLTVLATPHASDQKGITLAQQTAFLGAILGNHWLCLLALTKGRFWKHIMYWKSTSMLLAIEIPTRLSYFGWAGEGGIMNASVAIRIWLVGLCALCACGLICRYGGGSELIFDGVQPREDPTEESPEDDLSVEGVVAS